MLTKLLKLMAKGKEKVTMVDSALVTKASEELEQEIDEELEKKDPDKAAAKSLLGL